MRRALMLLIDGYRYFLSPWLGQNCRFYPSCSCYAREALEHHGALKGVYLTLRRLARCHPWHPGGYDPVPASPSTHSQHTSSTDPGHPRSHG